MVVVTGCKTHLSCLQEDVILGAIPNRIILQTKPEMRHIPSFEILVLLFWPSLPLDLLANNQKQQGRTPKSIALGNRVLLPP